MQAFRPSTESRPAARDEGPWSLGSDLDKYRAYAVAEGSRNSAENVGLALQRTGMAIEDTWNIVTLGYGTERAEPLRGNDGKGPLEQAGKALERGGDTIGNAAAGLYSLADLITLNALPDSESDVYQDNNPIVRPFIFTGRAIGNAFMAAAELGNTLTFGLFDNVAGSAGMLFVDAVEVVKHAGEAVTNLARGPVYLLTGQKEGVDKTLDWVLVVPLEFASNSVQMQGIGNMVDYETAFAEKGVIGSLLEMGGSTYILYRAIDEALDECDDDDNRQLVEKKEEPNPPNGGPDLPPVVPDNGGDSGGMGNLLGGFYRGANGEWFFVK